MPSPKISLPSAAHCSSYLLQLAALCSFLAVANPAIAAALSLGNLIVTVNEFTGAARAPTYVAEYDTSGARLQVIADVPTPGGTAIPTIEQARDLVQGADGSLYLYNGTFHPYLARLEPTAGAWSQSTLPGWSTVNNLAYGGVAALDQFIFATDMSTGQGGELNGIVRFNIADGSAMRFAEDTEPVDLYVSPNRILYSLSWPYDEVSIHDADTLASLGNVPVGSVGRRAVASDGASIFVADSNGGIAKYDHAGTLQKSLEVPDANFADIDIRGDGMIALGTTRDGEVVFTDVELNSFTRYRVTDSRSGGEVFVAWVTIPEPTSLGLGGGVLLFALASRAPQRR